MKMVLLTLAIAGLSLGSVTAADTNRAQRPADLVAHVHSEGFDQLRRGTNAPVLQNVWKMPATVELRNQALDKISRWLAAAFTGNQHNQLAESSLLIRPLLEDCLNAETIAEFRQPNGQPLKWSLAIRLNKERLDRWQKNCSELFGKNGKAGTAGVSYGKADDWFILTRSTEQNAVDQASGLVKGIVTGVKQSSAAKSFLKADISLPLLAQQFGWPGWQDGPTIDLKMVPRGEFLRTEMQVRYPKAQNWKLEPWQVPTSLIKDPLISFTAVQSIAPWLKKFSSIQDLAISPTPNQLFFWGQSPQYVFQIHAAAPVANVTNAFKRFEKQILPSFNEYTLKNGVGMIHPRTNQTALTWEGLGFLNPTIRTARDNGREFVAASLLQLSQSPFTNSPPAELFQQITGRSNLIYYDWEITHPRIIQLRDPFAMAAVVTTLTPLGTNAVAFRWLESAGARLGETVTEIAVTSPQELSIIRKSHIGFNGLELTSLAYWLNKTNFPAIDREWNFRAALLRNRARNVPPLP